MNNYLVLGIIAIVVILVLVALVVIGKKRAASKTVTFDKEEPKELTQQDRSGNYQAVGEFNFAPVQPEAELLPGQELHPTPHPTPQPQPEQELQVELPQEDPAEVVTPVTESELVEAPQLDDVTAPAGDEEAVQIVEETEPEPASSEDTLPSKPEGTTAPVVTEPTEEAPAAVPAEQIDPATGRLGRLRGRLVGSQNMIGKSLLGILSAGDLDDDAWEEIEDTLIMADLGAPLTMKVVDQLRATIAERGVSSEEEARAMLRETLIAACHPEMDRAIHAIPAAGKPAVVLVVGVNGTGKTTTTGKLARVLVSMGHSVVLGAADTFRAAAADQLETWGKRVGATTVRGAEGADPASVAFDAVSQGIDNGADVVLIDTAGRLHTAVGLMDQLAKVKRVVEKRAKVDEVLLVLDATVGQNGLMQARTFRDVVDLTGVVLTKLDGTARGGIVFQVQEELGVPVKLVGLGEGADDLAPFEVESFVDALLGGKHGA